MKKRVLIIHIPVIHKGYLDFLNTNREGISTLYLIDEKFLDELTEFKPDIASLDSQTARRLLMSIGFDRIHILSKKNLQDVKGKKLILIQDEASRNLQAKYFKKADVEWASVFLRWDKSLILSENPLNEVHSSKNPFDASMMAEAFREAQKSGDWWRQVGAVLVKDGTILARAYNHGVPTDHTPYQVGMVRDFFKAGEKQELSNTIHAEQKIIAEAAKNGVQVQGTSFYITHFPCAVCAKMISFSGACNLYFHEGASTLNGKKILESAGVKIFYVPKDFD